MLLKKEESFKESFAAILLTHLSKGNRQTTNTATTIANALALNVAISLNPVQDLLDGLIVAVANVKLDRVDLIGIGIDLVPAVETLGIEVFTDLGLVVHARGGKGGGCNRSWDRCARSNEGGSSVGGGGDKGKEGNR